MIAGDDVRDQMASFRNGGAMTFRERSIRPSPHARPARAVGDPRDNDVTVSQPVGSVVIPAHNEAQVIHRCLNALFAGLAPGDLDVVVVCNGCDDETAALARSCGRPVRVFELPIASKPAAIRFGDAAALRFPRLYLDADVVLPGASARRVLERLAEGAVAARPPVRYDTSESSAAVRSYYRARGRVPAVLSSLWGAGVYGLSASGRSRFEEFPDVVGDDLWLDGQFERDEVDIVECDPVTVMAPRGIADLIRVLRRTYRGKAERRSSCSADDRAREITRATLRDLRHLTAAGPQNAFDAVAYGAFAVSARLSLALLTASGRAASTAPWERDDSSRTR